MAKFSIAYVKSRPVMFGVIFLVFGVLFWFLISGRGGSASSGGVTTVVQQGPSDTAIAAGAQVQMAQIQAAAATNSAAYQFSALELQAENQRALAAMELSFGLQELGSNERIQEKTLTASYAALVANLDNNLAITESNNSFMVDYARVAADSATTQIAIGAALQRDLGAQQLDAYKTGVAASITQTALSIIPSLKKKNRDETLQILGSAAMGAPVGFVNTNVGTSVSNTGTVPTPVKRSGGFSLGGLISPLAGAIA